MCFGDVMIVGFFCFVVEMIKVMAFARLECNVDAVGSCSLIFWVCCWQSLVL
jgi:hypothetical protein